MADASECVRRLSRPPLSKPNRKNAPPKWRGKRNNEAMEAVHGAGPIGKRNVTNRFEAVSCQACGRKVRRKSRQQKFCSDRCRDFARRENNARTAIKNPVLGQDTGKPTNPPKSASKNNSLQAAKTGSSIPVNILGGYRWPSAPEIDARTLANVIRREIGGVS